MRLTGALDGDHSRARLPPLHFGEGFALVIRKVADRLYRRALHHLGRDFVANLAQVVDRFVRREAFGGVTSGVAVDEVFGVGDFFRAAFSPASTASATVAASGAPGLPLRALRASSVVRFPATE